MGDKGAQREVKIPAAEAKLMGARLKETLRVRKRNQKWLADQLDKSGEMVSRMINEGAGSLAAWRQACIVLEASMDYIVKLQYQKADPEFTHLIKAHGELVKELERLKAERDELFQQLSKLKMIGVGRR